MTIFVTGVPAAFKGYQRPKDGTKCQDRYQNNDDPNFMRTVKVQKCFAVQTIAEQLNTGDDHKSRPAETRQLRIDPRSDRQTGEKIRC